MDRNTAKSLSAEIMEAVKVVAARHGYTVDKGGVKYGDDTLKICNVTLTKSHTGSVVSSAPTYSGQLLFDNYKGVYGLAHVNMGEQYTKGSEVYELVGFKPSAPKYPILVKNVSNGKQYKTTWDALKIHFRR